MLACKMVLSEMKQIPLNLKSTMQRMARFSKLRNCCVEAGEEKNETACQGGNIRRTDPADFRFPRQNAKMSWIRNDDEIRRPGHLIQVHAAAARE